MQIAVAIMLGLGLSAACGLRVFVPMLVLSIAAKAHLVDLSPSLAWIGSTEGLVCLGVATVVEIVAYKIPWLDHALDTIASPAAIIAGAIVSASQIHAITGVHPMVQWTCAIIVGGGLAGLVQTGTVATRAASTVITGGFANPIISTIQSVASIVVSVLAVVVPIIGALFALCVVGGAVFLVSRWRKMRRNAAVTDTSLRLPRDVPQGLTDRAQLKA
ncbi:MAG TPA: DUF4126 domain-containing protein [Phycisphaerales bacterium]|nr:DUF4126 domain-containing protein [Phycisphaerales bacterium]